MGTQFDENSVDGISWNQFAKEFTHMWLCQNYVDIPVTTQISIESPMIQEDNKFGWTLELCITEPNGNSLGSFVLIPHARCPTKFVASVNFLDNNGKIFLPNGCKNDVKEVTFANRGSETPIRFPFSFKFSEHLDSLLHEGSLRILLRIWRTGVEPTGTYDKSRQTPVTMESDFWSLFLDSTAADVTICAGGKEFPTHKTILIARSKVFRAMFAAPMTESTTNCVKINNFPPEIVKGMLRYIYTNETRTSESPELYLEIADFFGLRGLKDRVVQCLCGKISTENVVEMFRYSLLYDSYQLKMAVKLFISKLSNKNEITSGKAWAKLAKTNMRDVLDLFGSMIT